MGHVSTGRKLGRRISENWDEVFEAARAKAYQCYEDKDDDDVEVKSPEEEVPASPPRQHPAAGVWDESTGAHDDADFDVDEKDEIVIDDEEEKECERRRAAAEGEAKIELEREENERREAFLRESEREKLLTEKYTVKKEENEG